ncbi:MAG: biosynthetic-type acetolactate synthase large subunit [Thermaerobacter sp.]|nr:biosynthetic-type acetolactate synthase large subunit [Thermaerobacter sp.]
MTGAERTWDVLTKLGVDVIFGVPGGAILPLVDAMVAQQGDLRFVVTRHESAAVHAADGYARVSGKPGVVLATSGPGGTNVITGLATAMADSVPLVLVLGQVASGLIGTDAFQEADLFGMTMPVVKHSWRIRHAGEIGPVLTEAYRIAQFGRPGPVVIEFPKDTQMQEVDNEPASFPEPPAPVLRPQPLAWARARAYLARSRRPIFYIGGGVVISGTAPTVKRLAERYQAPVTTTLMGLGAFPSSHPLSIGMLGMHGTWTANHAMQQADLIIALGVRFDDRVTGRLDSFAPHARIIHVEVDPSEINKIVASDAALVGDLAQILPQLERHLPEAAQHDEWLAQLARWQAEHPVRVPESPAGAVAAPRALQILRSVIRPEDIVVTEVGQHQMWTALFIPRDHPRTFVTSGGVGTMGHGFPAAMGAQVGRPDVRVYLIAGDGSFQMNLQELATLVQYQIPIRIIVLNNQGHGMVRQWQDLFHGGRRYGVKLLNPDFVKLAQAYGMNGFTVNSEGALAEALTVLADQPGPVLLEVVVPEDEHVYPMVPAGRSLSEVIEGA